MYRFGTILLLVGSASASFCGDSAIPFSFEALPDGQPVLGCARPTCFGWSPEGEPATHNGNFYRINKKPDGFMRNDRTSIPAFNSQDPRFVQKMTANCEATFQSSSCSAQNQWAAGIAPLLNVSAFPAVLQCCTYEPLTLSTDRGVAVVNNGQIVVGGEVLRNNRQYAFDYIADITKNINADGTVSYDVSVRRMPCLPLPEDTQREAQEGGFRAYQAPNVVRDPINIAEMPGNGAAEQVDGPFTNEENGVVEEVVAEEGVEVEPQQPQAPPATSNAGVQFFEARPVFAPGQAAPPQIAQVPIQQPQFIQGPAVFQPAAPAAPAYYGGGGGGGGGGSYYCFTADTTVETASGRSVRMDELQEGDWIKTLNNSVAAYSPVKYWLHRVPTQEADFIKFTLEDGTHLKLTGMHYIYRTTCSGANQVDEVSNEAVFAEKVNEGDCLYRVNEKNEVYESRVVKKELVTETGIYAPMTSNGKLVVNGVYASCHNIVQHHTLQNTFFSYVDAFNKLMTNFFDKEDVHELPYGIDTILSMMDLVMPKSLMSA